jgi:acyl carrier protein
MSRARRSRARIAARAALDQLGQVLAGPASALEDGVVFIAQMNWGKARDFLPSLRSPTFADLARGQDTTEASERGTIDVRAIIAADGRDAARRRVCDAIVEELARILRLPQEDVPRAKPLAEIGLDSLMGVELAISIEERFALQGSLTASATGLTIAEFGDQIIGMSDDTETASTSVIAARRRASISARRMPIFSAISSDASKRSAPPSEAVRLGRRFTMPCARSRRGGA